MEAPTKRHSAAWMSVLIRKRTPRERLAAVFCKGHCVNIVSDPLTALDAEGGVRFQGEPRPGHLDMWDVK